MGSAKGARGQRASSSGAVDAGAAGEVVEPRKCLQIAFPAMHSGYSDGSQSFKIAAVVPGMSGVRWSSTDTSMVDLDPTDRTAGDGSVMITTKKAGTVKIIARAGPLAGAATLEITSFDPADCALGKMLYEGEIPDAGVVAIPDPGFGGATTVACNYCHGEGPDFASREYTPMQTGGWSDFELRQIFDSGVAPNGAVSEHNLPARSFTLTHRVAASPSERTGLLCYLRSIEPGSRDKLDFQGALVAAGSSDSQAGAGTVQCGALDEQW